MQLVNVRVSFSLVFYFIAAVLLLLLLLLLQLLGNIYFSSKYFVYFICPAEMCTRILIIKHVINTIVSIFIFSNNHTTTTTTNMRIYMNAAKCNDNCNNTGDRLNGFLYFWHWLPFLSHFFRVKNVFVVINIKFVTFAIVNIL